MTFQKFDTQKPDYNLLDWDAIEDLIKVLQHGAEKYGRNNWKECTEEFRYANAINRHVAAIQKGEITDPESGLPHAAHIMASAMFLNYFAKKSKDKNVLSDNLDKTSNKVFIPTPSSPIKSDFENEMINNKASKQCVWGKSIENSTFEKKDILPLEMERPLFHVPETLKNIPNPKSKWYNFDETIPIPQKNQILEIVHENGVSVKFIAEKHSDFWKHKETNTIFYPNQDLKLHNLRFSKTGDTAFDFVLRNVKYAKWRIIEEHSKEKETSDKNISNTIPKKLTEEKIDEVFNKMFEE